MNVFSRLANSLTLAYEPMRYWNTRRYPNADIGEEKNRIEFDTSYIRENVNAGDRVLELGPGLGRTFPAYAPDTEVVTLDISRNYQEELNAVANSLGLKLEQRFLASTLEPFPFADRQFDVGVSFQVFIHQPPDVFAHNFSEMARVCGRLIVSVGLHRNTSNSKRAIGRHVFRHDYILEASKRGKRMSNLLENDRVLYFIVHEKNWSPQASA